MSDFAPDTLTAWGAKYIRNDGAYDAMKKMEALLSEWLSFEDVGEEEVAPDSLIGRTRAILEKLRRV
jgi:hypothetical protein